MVPEAGVEPVTSLRPRDFESEQRGAVELGRIALNPPGHMCVQRAGQAAGPQVFRPGIRQLQPVVRPLPVSDEPIEALARFAHPSKS